MIGRASPPLGRQLLAAQHLRLFAFLLDYLMIIAGLKLAEQVLLGSGWDLRMAAAPPRVFPLWWLAAVAGSFAVKDLLGSSPGKWLTGISVRRRDAPTERPPPWRLVARNASLLLLPLDVYSLFRDPQLRRWGDRWFGTVVVVRQPEVSIVQRAFGLGSLFLGFILVALLVTSWNLRRTSAYQVAQRAIQSQPALTALLGAPVTVEGSPTLELRLDQGQALFIFQAKGKQRSAEVRVRLVLIRSSPASWSVGSIDMPNPAAGGAPPVTDAPPQPASNR
jgi:hypothetical protein